MSFAPTDPASWTEGNLDDQNKPTLQAVIDGLGLVLDKDDTQRGRYKGKVNSRLPGLKRGLRPLGALRRLPIQAAQSRTGAPSGRPTTTLRYACVGNY